MKIRLSVILAMLLTVGLGYTQTQGTAAETEKNYSSFQSLSENQKDKIIWDLFEKKEFGKPDQKPIFREILSTKGKICHADAVSFTTATIDVVEQNGWKEFDPLILEIYRHPPDVYLYKRAFLYFYKQRGMDIPNDLIEASKIIMSSGFYNNMISDNELERAKTILWHQADMELTLVYALEIANTYSKGGSDRGRLSAIDVLKKLDRNLVYSRLKSFDFSFATSSNSQDDIVWVLKEMNKN